MRLAYLTTCAAALVACSDSKSPTGPDSSTRLAPARRAPEPAAPSATFDPRSLTERIETLVTARLGQVVLPPDAFSASADAVHPDIACPDGGWNGGACWFMYTPYKNSDPAWENPGFLLASSDTTWVTPPQLINPIVQYPGAGSYNSDPDHAFDPSTGRLVQMYRVVADTMNRIMVMSTGNAHQWTPPLVAFAERAHDAVSPALIIEKDRTGKVWYVRSGRAGCTSQTTVVALRTARPDPGQPFETAQWSDPTPVDLTIPGYNPWHLDVAELPHGGYIALIAAYQKGFSCGQSDLWLARSDDGLSWRTMPLPIFWRGMAAARRREISTWYRGTLRYDAASDVLDLWPSALAGPSWSIYHSAFKLSDLTALMSGARASDRRSAIAASRRVPGARIPMP